MVKVVGRDEKEVHKKTCKTCASVLEYTLDEVQSFVHKDYGGGSDTYYYIDCPKCTEKVYVKNR